MRLFKRLNNWLNDIYSADDREDIIELEVDNAALKIQIHNLQADMNNMELALLTMKKENKELLVELQTHQKHSSLEIFREWLDSNVLPKVKKWDYDGEGPKPCHESLEKNNRLKHLAFLKDVLKFDFLAFNSADDMVYKFNIAFNKKYPQPQNYESDKKSYGIPEYWESPDEAIDRLRKKKKMDCDGVSAAKYGLTLAMLETRFPQDTWRIRSFIVKTISGETHYLLAWAKEGVNDWIPIETTWYVESFARAWNENLTLRDNSAYKILWSFDEDYEYEKL